MRLSQDLSCSICLAMTWEESESLQVMPKLMETVDTLKLEGRVDIQFPNQWTKKLMKFKNNKHKVLHLGRKNLLQEHRRVTGKLKSSFSEKDLEVVLDKKLNMNQRCAIAWKQSKIILGYLSRNTVRKLRKKIISDCSELVSPTFRYYNQVPSCPHHSSYKDVEKLTWVIQQRASKMLRSLRISPAGRVWESWAYSAQRRDGFSGSIRSRSLLARCSMKM